MRRSVIVGSAVLVAAGIAAAVLLTRGSSPEPLSVDDVAVGGPAAADAPVPSLDGTWTIVEGEETTAGLRIAEERFGGLGDHTAVGRTGDVSGDVSVVDGIVTDATVAVDLSTIEFTDDPGIPVAGRTDYLRSRALETDRFPEASFVLDEPVDVGALAQDGTRTIEVEGRLTLRDVERDVRFDVDVRRTDDGFAIATSDPVPVRLSDHGIEAPSLPGVSEVADVGEFEFLVLVEPGP